MADVNTNFLGLLNGIIHHDYYNDISMTDELLKIELYRSAPPDEFSSLVHKVRGMIKSMAAADMDVNQVEAFLISQTKKRDGGITEDQAKAFMKCWKTNKNKIHDSLVRGCIWNNRLTNLSWRIDVKSSARHAEQVNAASAIVEMQLENTNLQETKVEVIRFEMDETGLSKVLQSLKDVEEQIDRHCKHSTQSGAKQS